MPIHFDDDLLERERKKYELALEAVESGLSRKVQSSYGQFLHAINDVQSLSNDLLNCTKLCSEAKIDLSNSKDHIAKGGVLIANNYRRRQRCKEIYENLIKLRQFMKLRTEMEKATKAGDFNKALSISLANKEIYRTLKDFKCVEDMSNTLSGEMSWLKERLDRAIISMFKTKFDEHSFSSLLETEILMHETNHIVSRLKGHFKNSIEAVFRRSLITSLLLENRDDVSADTLETKKTSSLYKRLKEYHFPACLNIAFEQLCNYMYCFHKMVEWLKEQSQKEYEDVSMYNEIYQGLFKYKRIVWDQTIQTNILLILDYANFEEFAFDKCLAILDLVRKFLSIAEDFAGTPAYLLRDRFKVSSDLYFVYFHKSNMEHLKESFEKETWMSIEISPGFSIEDMDAFKDLLCEVIPMHRRYKRRQKSLFSTFELQGNPFEFKEGQDLDDGILSDDPDEDLDPELLVDQVDEPGLEDDNISKSKGPIGSHVPLLSSVTNVLIKTIGKYLNVMKILEQSTTFVYDGIEQLLKLYLYCVHNAFIPNLSDYTHSVDENVMFVLKFVERNLICDAVTVSHGLFTNLKKKISLHRSHDGLNNRGSQPNTPIKRTASHTNNDFGVLNKQGLSITDIKVQRPKLAIVASNNLPFQTLVAYESLCFLKNALKDMKLTFMEFLPDNNARVLSTYEILIPSISSISDTVLKNLAISTLTKEKVVSNVLSVRWDTQSFELDASPYVSLLIKDVEQFNQKFRVLVKVQHISTQTANNAIQKYTWGVAEMLVHAYSQIKKISDGGRQLLTINTQEIKMGIERVIEMKGLNWSFLDGFIHAFHYPDEDIKSFIRNSKEYTNEQLKGLIEMGNWSDETKTICTKMLLNNVN